MPSMYGASDGLHVLQLHCGLYSRLADEFRTAGSIIVQHGGQRRQRRFATEQ